MPFRGLLDVQEAAFDPEDITAITAAHEMTVKRLGVTDRKSAMAFLVAKTVIQIATGGERDPERLSESVIRILQSRASE
jgi:aryl-alcohol dehydrogenase-like predicted oxidoreductase